MAITRIKEGEKVFYFAQSAGLRLGNFQKETRYTSGALKDPESSLKFHNHFIVVDGDDIDANRKCKHIESVSDFKNGKIKKVDEKFYQTTLENIAKRINIQTVTTVPAPEGSEVLGIV